MSLNNISLPSHLLAELYRNTLVEDTATGMPQKKPLPYLGKNGKNILILVHKPDALYLPDSELAFLTKVLSACQLGLADVAIVNWSKAPHQDVAAIIGQFQATSIILFGLEPVLFQLPSDLVPYTVYTFDKRQFVIAPALNDIEKTKETKGQLWLVLKQLFCI